MKRFILNTAPDKNGNVRLGGEDYHYLVRVRRLASGEYFPALLPTGEEIVIQVRSVEGGFLHGLAGESASSLQAAGPLCDARTSSAPSLEVPIMLFQALPKGEKMDLIVRQAAEGAVNEIVPFVSEFSIPKVKGDSAGKKLSRWERIIKEARQQSGSATATLIRQPISIDALFAHWEAVKQRRPGALGLLFHHEPVCPQGNQADEPLAQASLHGYLGNNPEAVALAIGPEGGFSPAEADRFMEAGFKPVTIGGTVLRTETAALYGSAAIRIILLERNSWEMKPTNSMNGSIC
jgi:16S rRNA (uracil1498-N3)-methyltransferase